MTTPSSAAEPRSSLKGIFSRYVLPLFLLVLIVGGIAWVLQYHSRWHTTKTDPVPVSKSLLVFRQSIARWIPESKEEDTTPEPKSDKAKGPKSEAANFKEFEVNSHGHYDFLFRNESDQEVEIGLARTGCDCASVHVGVVSALEWASLDKFQQENVGEPLPYKQEPAWHELFTDPKKKGVFLLKPKDHGVVRVKWHVRKQPGQDLNLKVDLWWGSAADPSQRRPYGFAIPGTVTNPVRVNPQRVNVGYLSTGKPKTAEFDLWSPTRDSLDLKLTAPPPLLPDPLLVIETRVLSKSECTELEALWKNQLKTHVRSAYHVKVTVHEQIGAKQLEQGVFYRKLPIYLDGHYLPDVPGPEIIGRVKTDVVIGGSDDQGKIRFKPFDSRLGSSRTIELSTEGNVKLERFNTEPHSLKIELTRDEKNSTPERTRWRLTVTVPPNAFSGSFSEEHAVTLRVLGESPRLIRIPLEGDAG